MNFLFCFQRLIIVFGHSCYIISSQLLLAACESEHRFMSRSDLSWGTWVPGIWTHHRELWHQGLLPSCTCTSPSWYHRKFSLKNPALLAPLPGPHPPWLLACHKTVSQTSERSKFNLKITHGFAFFKVPCPLIFQMVHLSSILELSGDRNSFCMLTFKYLDLKYRLLTVKHTKATHL